MCLNGLRCSQNAGKWQFERTKFQIFLGGHAPKPPSLIGANHSYKTLDPPLWKILEALIFKLLKLQKLLKSCRAQFIYMPTSALLSVASVE